MMWFAMRQAAMWRHRWWNMAFEGGNPQAWEAHRAMVRQFYGF